MALRAQAAEFVPAYIKKQDESDKKSEGKLCSICHDDLVGDLYTTVCEHTFHRVCLRNWINQPSSRQRCPLCRVSGIGAYLDSARRRDLPRMRRQTADGSFIGFSESDSDSDSDSDESDFWGTATPLAPISRLNSSNYEHSATMAALIGAVEQADGQTYQLRPVRQRLPNPRELASISRLEAYIARRFHVDNPRWTSLKASYRNVETLRDRLKEYADEYRQRHTRPNNYKPRSTYVHTSPVFEVDDEEEHINSLERIKRMRPERQLEFALKPIPHPQARLMEKPFSLISYNQNTYGYNRPMTIKHFTEFLPGEELFEVGQFHRNIQNYYWIHRGNTDYIESDDWYLFCSFKCPDGELAHGFFTASLALPRRDYRTFNRDGIAMRLAVSKSAERLFMEGMTADDRHHMLFEKFNRGTFISRKTNEGNFRKIHSNDYRNGYEYYYSDGDEDNLTDDEWELQS